MTTDRPVIEKLFKDFEEKKKALVFNPNDLQCSIDYVDEIIKLYRTLYRELMYVLISQHHPLRTLPKKLRDRLQGIEKPVKMRRVIR